MPPDRNRIIKINNTIAFYAPDISSLKISTQDNPYFEENMAMLRKFLPALSSAPVVVRRHCLYVTSFQIIGVANILSS